MKKNTADRVCCGSVLQFQEAHALGHFVGHYVQLRQTSAFHPTWLWTCPSCLGPVTDLANYEVPGNPHDNCRYVIFIDANSWFIFYFILIEL
jgi:hypothetical protein